MGAIQTVQNVLRGLVQRYGTEHIKRQLWNREYENGRWQCLDGMAGDCVYPHLEKYAVQGRILDLGCGPGAVGNVLNADAYQAYVGVDICDVAVERAQRRTAESGRSEKNVYVQSDIFSYVPEDRYNVLFFGDSIYYFSQQRILEMLNRYSNYLNPDGVFIVRSWMIKKRHREIVHHIENQFELVEKSFYAGSRLCVIVFRPRLVREGLRVPRAKDPA